MQSAIVSASPLHRQIRLLCLAAEARLRLAEQEIPPSPTKPPEYAKQQAAHDSKEGIIQSTTAKAPADERQECLRASASEMMHWREGLKVHRMAQLPKWRGFFKWQTEAKLEALQAEYATLRAEVSKPDG